MKTVKLWICFFIILFSFPYLEAGTTGKIKGNVANSETGEPIIGANILIEGTRMGAAADHEGSYFIINVPPGEYNLIITAIGYGKITVTGVRVFIDRTTTRDIKMAPVTLQMEDVVIVATRPVVEKDRTNTASYLSSQEIEVLPVQEIDDIIQLQTGVVKDASGRFHMRGGRFGEIAYLIDGVSVTDQYRGGSSIEFENSWVQELQVISGTFNAEYGQAQSGVINIVSKEGAKKFSGKLSLYAGDYISSRENTFMNIDKLDLGEKDAALSLSGPVKLLPNSSFYFSFRYNHNEGWLYGQRRTRIQDTVPIQQYMHIVQQNLSNEERLLGVEIPDSLQTGDGALVAMNPNTKISFYGKLSFNPFTSFRVNYSLISNYSNGKNYSDYRRYAPDGVPTFFSNKINHILNFTQTISKSTFYTANISYFSQNNQSYLFEDPLSPFYQGNPFATNGFAFGGTSNGRSNITNSAWTTKFDLTSQVNKYNLLKLGAEVKKHNLKYRTLSTISYGPVYEEPNLRIPAYNTSRNNSYQHSPLEVAFYAQDKVELNEIIFNAGLRMEYWHPKAKVPADLQAVTRKGDGIRLDSDLKDAENRVQLSPRLGLAYPISDEGVIHVSYGHFFQLPRFSYVFSNSEFEIELGDLESIMGNANLKPEKTIAYEVGLQQQLGVDYSLNFTLYYKDIKNLLGQEIINTRDKKIYARYINRDYGNVKGFVISLRKRYSDLFSGSIDYTFQIARGNASDPNAIFVDFQSRPPKESEKQVIPLNWDQRHTINPTLVIGNPSDWNVGLIGRFTTGQPYTPSNPGSQLTTQFENSDRKPFQYNIDLSAYKIFRFSRYKLRLFLKIYNLTDRLNPKNVYSSTGTASFPYRSPVARQFLLQNPNFTLNEIDLRPDFYSAPRRMTFGTSIEF